MPADGLQNPNPARIRELDGVRGIAILLVLIWHYPAGVFTFEPGSTAEAIKNLVAFTAQGVDLFFVLSGFLIGGILFRYRHAPNFFPTFYLRRFLRLAPVYFLVLLGYILLQVWPATTEFKVGNWLLSGSWTQQQSPIPDWSYFVYLQNIFMADANKWGGQWLAPTWSLAVEEQFYLIAPLVIWLLPKRFIPIAIGILILSAPIFRVLASEYTGSFWASHVLLFSRLDALFAGILMAFYLRDPDVDTWLRANSRAILRTTGYLVAAVIVMSAIGIRTGTPGMLVTGYTLVMLASVGLILTALYVKDHWVITLFRNRQLAQIGIVSYGIYLLHMPVLGLTAMVMGDQFTMISLVLAAAATFVLAALSWRYFEQPILTYGRRFEYAGPRASSIDGAATTARLRT